MTTASTSSKTLDPQQMMIVNHGEGPAVVVAGAGAGKTTLLTHRIAHLIHNGVEPEAILLLAFTRAASREMTERAKATEPRAGRIMSGTFHSVASRVIKDNIKILGLAANYTVLDPGDNEDILRKITAGNPIGEGAPQNRTIAKMISYAINTQIELNKTIHQGWPQYAHFAKQIVEIAEKYKKYKRARSILDFDDLLFYFAKLAENERSGPMLRERFRYIMIDEYQDTNALQLRLIYALGGDNGNIVVVGDPSQSIYGFRGAKPSVMFDFQTHFRKAKTFLIETNYRSTPEIVRLADSVDHALNERFERKLKASRKSRNELPRLIIAEDDQAEADKIAATILENRENGLKFSDQAILVRSSRFARIIELALTRFEIPYKFSGGTKIHESRHIRDVIAALRILLNPLDEPAWLRFLTLFPKIGDKAASQLFAALQAPSSLIEALEQMRPHAKKPHLEAAVDALGGVASHTQPGPAMNAVLDAISPYAEDLYKDEWSWRRREIEDIVDLAANYDNIDEFLKLVTIDVSLDKTSHGRNEILEDGVVTVSTIHSAKGLEWRYVFIPAFANGHIPSMQVKTANDIEEEKRLLYVAVTRARDNLDFLKPHLKFSKGRSVWSESSPFEEFIRPFADVVNCKLKAKTSTRLDIEDFVIDMSE